MLIIAPAITAKSFGHCTPAKLLNIMISSDCLVLLVIESLHIAFFYLPGYFALSIRPG